MLSVGKLAKGQEGYYLSQVARGVEDYYTGHGEAPGRWLGTGAATLDLEGTVAPEDLGFVLAGDDPRTGRHLGTVRTVPGFDLTFSAPKSVSLLFALGEGLVPAEVVDAHEAAVDAAMGYLERQACMTRRGRAGFESAPGRGFIAAAFRHRTSRAGDPQLHTHVLVANMTEGPDGRWTSLDARHLYWHQRTAGFLYQAQLRAELTRRLGVAWETPVNGMANVRGIPETVLRAFSKRRREIEAHLAERAMSSAKAAEIAALSTRKAKDYNVDSTTLADRWRLEADALEFGPKKLRSLLGRGREPVPVQTNRTAVGEALTEHLSHFDRRDAVRHFAEISVEGADIADIEARGDRFLSSPTAVPLSEGNVGMRFSTPDLLRIEASLLRYASVSSPDMPTADQPSIDRATQSRPTLSDEQRTMVEAVCTSRRTVDVVVGVAGSGKTYAFDTARDAWQRSGCRVVGCALAARAAAELESNSGIPSFTIDSLLIHLDQPGTPGFAKNTIVVVDEASMVGTRKLARLSAHAQRSGAKVVLVGDPQQLPEVEAGGIFGRLANGPTATLIENRRQRDPQERRALADWRAGLIKRAMARLESIGHIKDLGDAEETRARLVTDWWRHTQGGEDALMLAIRRRDVRDLNDAATALLIEEGDLGEPIETEGGTFWTGQAVVCLRNNRDLGVVNGLRGVAVGGTADGGIEITTGAGTRILPSSYLADGHLDAGYALTIHKAQGVTCDRTLLLGTDSLYREAGYTALSRGRRSNVTYSVAETLDDEAPRIGLDLEASLAMSKAQHLAVDLATAP